MITYRQPIALDIPVLASYEKELFPYSPWSTSQFKEEFAGIPTTRFMSVAEADNTIIGYCGVFLPAPGVEADILTVAVLPEYQHRGIGSHILSEMLAYSREMNAHALIAHSELPQDARSAYEFYVKFFQERGINYKEKIKFGVKKVFNFWK